MTARPDELWPMTPAIRRVVALAPRGLTILELRRRLRGRGSDRLRLNVLGRAIAVSPEFGHALETLAFAGAIYIDDGMHVLPGRAYGDWLQRRKP